MKEKDLEELELAFHIFNKWLIRVLNIQKIKENFIIYNNFILFK